MRVGTLCYAANSGLGLLAKAFVTNGVITEVLRVRHPHYQNFPEWYPGSSEVDYRSINLPAARGFCRTVDAMFFFETPFNWELISFCKDARVKTIMMPMHEYMPEHWPCQPDLIINPSLLEQRLYPQGIFIPVPVEVPWKLRTKAEVFVHNAGHGGVQGRNGTNVLLEAILLADCFKSDSNAQLIIRSQTPIKNPAFRGDLSGKVKWINGRDVPYGDLWSEGDVFVFPERFNGLSLPLQEAYASGMLVMGTDRFPMNTWLPRAPLISDSEIKRNRVDSYHQPFDESIVYPKDIALMIDSWYGADIREYSYQGKSWASNNSWEALKPRYLKAIEDLCQGLPPTQS